MARSETGKVERQMGGLHSVLGLVTVVRGLCLMPVFIVELQSSLKQEITWSFVLHWS